MNIVKTIKLSDNPLLLGMSAKQVLSELRSWLTAQGLESYSPTSEAAQLWDVLSALRGPDADTLSADGDEIAGSDLKQATTGVIRRAVLGPDIYDVPASWNSSDSEDGHATRDMVDSGAFYHFVDHAKRAFNVLGLDWFGLNQFDDQPQPVGSPADIDRWDSQPAGATDADNLGGDL